MSYQSWCRARTDIHGTKKTVLNALCVYKDLTPEHRCFPSVWRLACDIGRDPRTVRHTLRALEKDGEISIVIQGTGRRSSIYDVLKYVEMQPVGSGVSPAPNGDTTSGIGRIARPDRAPRPPTKNGIRVKEELKSAKDFSNSGLEEEAAAARGNGKDRESGPDLGHDDQGRPIAWCRDWQQRMIKSDGNPNWRAGVPCIEGRPIPVLRG